MSRHLVCVVRIALLGAVLYVSQLALSFLPNIELVTLLIVIFTKCFGKEGVLSCFVYVLLTAFSWGFGLWWFTYLVVWPAFALLVYFLRNIKEWIIWAIINGAFGLCFGAFFALPYVFMSPSYAFSYWIAGIPWDVAHCVGNFFIALVLGKPLCKAIERVKRYQDKL